MEEKGFNSWEEIREYIINRDYKNNSKELNLTPEIEEDINQKVWLYVKYNLIFELRRMGIRFKFEFTNRDKNGYGAYYSGDEWISEGIGNFFIIIPEGQRYSNSQNPFDNRDLFEYVYSLFHEYKHLLQRKEYTYEAKDTEENRSYAKAQLIVEHFGVAYENVNYADDPRELDAQIYGIEHAIEYIKEHFLWVNAEQECITFVKGFAEGQRKSYGDKKKLSFNDEKCSSVSEILEDLYCRKNNPEREKLTKEAIDYEYYCESGFFDETDQDYIFRKLVFEEYLNKYNECEDVTQKDDMLVEAIIRVYPNALDEYPLIKKIKQKMSESKKNENDSAEQEVLNVNTQDLTQTYENMGINETDINRVFDTLNRTRNEQQQTQSQQANQWAR